jgi:hypothetical protein
MLQDGVRYSDPSASIVHTVTVDDVTAWALEVARRDTLRHVMPDPALLQGPRKRWAHSVARRGVDAGEHQLPRTLALIARGGPAPAFAIAGAACLHLHLDGVSDQ